MRVGRLRLKINFWSWYFDYRNRSAIFGTLVPKISIVNVMNLKYVCTCPRVATQWRGSPPRAVSPQRGSSAHQVEKIKRSPAMWTTSIWTKNQ